MKKILILFLFLPIYALGQLADDFSDGDFTANPAWVGTDTSFMINGNQQLQSAATTAGEAWLSLALPSNTKAHHAYENGVLEWYFWIRENFSPSGNNYTDVWLVSDTMALPNATQGYFLRFGSAGSQDAIELYRKDPDGTVLICKGPDATIASSFKVAVKVKRSADGHWTVMTDYSNIGNYVVEAEGFDNTYPIVNYFGFHLHFTSSNSKKFYFDDVYIGPEIIDTEPPELISLEVQDARHLLLHFSEPLLEDALDPQHYQVEGSPDTVGFVENSTNILLSFNAPLPENTNLTLRILGLTDLAGNTMPLTERDFAIYKAAENDVVINEIMADPTPVVGLPEWEFVELFNTTDFTIDLRDWTFFVGNTSKSFPSIQLNPHDYLILCKSDAEEELNAYGPTCVFSSFSIANAGASLRLVAPDETLVSEVAFNDSWYHDPEKREGGWSLEQIDPFNPCGGTANWSASTDPSGGTPGRENAINAPNAIEPSVARVSMLGDNMVLLWFDQQMDVATLVEPLNYRVVELDLHPSEVICNPVESSSLELLFDYHFEEGEVYTLTIQEVESCSGQPIGQDTDIRFGIPNEISEGDILINEILFDPVSPGVDYVELYNHSEKTFDLRELKLGVAKENFPNPIDTVLKTITDDSRLMMPHSYVLLSTNGYMVSQQYHCAMEGFVDMGSFPSYANSGGMVLLMSRQGKMIDQMSFSEQMHYPLLKETKGVSLERVSWEVPSCQSDNWHSAAEAVGFGTPGYRNSMMDDAMDLSVENPIRVEPKVFSPDGDGFDDSCLFRYQLDSSGCTMNVYVFSSDGRMVRHLVRGELVASEGGFVWNGLDNHGRRVPIGIYVVVTEVFDMEGMTSKYKSAVAVSSQ